MVLCAFIISFTKSWKLTLVIATIIPYIVISTGFFGGWSAKVEGKVNETLNHASGVAEEALSSVLNVTALGASEKIVARFDVYLKSSARLFKRIGPLQACLYGNSKICSPLSTRWHANHLSVPRCVFRLRTGSVLRSQAAQ
jgi:ATP-binding cassette subfamily B (MDR/TAP) protein 1